MHVHRVTRRGHYVNLPPLGVRPVYLVRTAEVAGIYGSLGLRGDVHPCRTIL